MGDGSEFKELFGSSIKSDSHYLANYMINWQFSRLLSLHFGVLWDLRMELRQYYMKRVVTDLLFT